MKVIIGSTAMRRHFPRFREAKDIDILFEVEGEVPTGYDSYLIRTFKLSDYFTEELASVDQLYTIKVSHIFWNNNYEKHLSDIRYLQRAGAKLIPDLYKALYKEWEEFYGAKKAKLDVSAADFFKSTITRVYEHDSIHKSVAYYQEPLFNKILKDGSEVAVSKDKFLALTKKEKLELVSEELYATALERLIIPSHYSYNARRAYWWALKRTITSFSKGWFPLWIVTNIDSLWAPDINYVSRHKSNKHMLIPIGEEDGSGR